MNIKTFIILFILCFLVSCSSNKDKKDNEVKFPEYGSGLRE